MTLSGPMQMAYFLASVLHGYCTRAIARAMLLLNSGVSWCAFLFSMASGPSSTIFEALAWREVLKVLMHDCRWTKEIHSVVILLLPTPAWKNWRKEGSRPLHEKNLFTLIRLRSFFPVYYTIGTMNTERQRLNGCSSSHTSTYRDSSVLLLQYPNGHDKNPAKKSCDYGLKTLVICPPHSLASYSVLKVSQASLFKQLGIQRIQSWEISNDHQWLLLQSLYPNYIVCLPCLSLVSPLLFQVFWIPNQMSLNGAFRIS